MLHDRVLIHDLSTTAIIGRDAWNNRTPQPISISVSLHTDFQKASASDDLRYSLNYAVISRSIARYMADNARHDHRSLRGVCEAISKVVSDPQNTGGGVPLGAEITVESKKSEIRAQSIRYTMGPVDTVAISGLRLLTLIGVFTFERLQKQYVDLDIEIQTKNDLAQSAMVSAVAQYVEQANFKTVEALVQRVAQLVHDNHAATEVFVRAIKPNAINYTEGVGVSTRIKRREYEKNKEIENEKNEEMGNEKNEKKIGNKKGESNEKGEYEEGLIGDKKEKGNIQSSFNLPVSQVDDFSGFHTAYIAFGSNTGNQVANIESALGYLSQYGISVESTSSMYMSQPMYHKEQAPFYNGVVKVTFEDLTPHELLTILKKIEYEHVKRVKEFENGPRSIDLDIVLYDDIAVNSPTLTVPHKLMLERTFVMQPLCELVPSDMIHPISTEPLHNHLRELLSNLCDDSLQESSELVRVVPLPRTGNSWDLTKTSIMGILNTTPDSFSDGGAHDSVDHAVSAALAMVKDGASVIDIGGVSTRPGAAEPTLQEELARVVPVVKALREADSKVLISVDTYRSEVAEAVLDAGADIINDISMGTYDNKLFGVIAKYGCPYVMSHVRGTPKNMDTLTKYEDDESVHESFADPRQGVLQVREPLISALSRELSVQMERAFAAGVRKWQIVVDPGIGFAKTSAQNWAILRNLRLLKRYAVKRGDFYIHFTFPVLIGTSRKRFLGEMTGNKPEERVVESVATIVGGVQQGVDIVRVHDVRETREGVRVAERLFSERAQ